MKGCAPARTRFKTEVTATRADMAYCTTEDGSHSLSHSLTIN